MLKSIKLQNFRKHTDSEFTFGDGLHCIRGSNEAGKSTSVEAIAYALFGVKTIRSSLEDCVTWGQPVNTLKVVLTLDVDGVTYTITRGKSGCECLYSGQSVTGQTEVTNFMSRLLKVDAASASRLMLSTQLDIRGALEAGTKATTELIERLSEFDQIDHLIELMQEKLTLGSTATAQANVEASQIRLDAANLVQQPDFDALEGAIAAQAGVVEAATQGAADAREAYNAQVHRHAQVQAKAGEWAALTSRAGEWAIKQSEAKQTLERLQSNPVKEVERADERIQDLMQWKTNQATVAGRLKVYKQVLMYLGVTPHDRIDTSVRSLQEQIDELQEGVGVYREELRKGVRSNNLLVASCLKS